MSPDEALVRARAYQIWEMENRPDGRAHLHWEEAVRQLSLEAAPAKPKRARKPAEAAKPAAVAKPAAIAKPAARAKTPAAVAATTKRPKTKTS